MKKYVFLDLEYNNKNRTIRELGIADIDEKFNALEGGHYLIDKGNINGYMDRQNKAEETFAKIRNYLSYRLCGDGNIVVGWDITNDVKMIETACDNNFVKPLEFTYFDLQKCYMEIYKKNKISLKDAIEEIGDGLYHYHNALEDVRATIAIAKQLCNKMRMSMHQMVEYFKNCIGETKKNKHSWKKEKIISYKDNLISSFNVSLDFPVIAFKKNIGPLNQDGVKDGICIYYNPLLDECYYGHEHPGNISKVKGSYLKNHPIYFNKELMDKAHKKKEEFNKKFATAKKKESIMKYIVSYDLVVQIENGQMNLFFSNKKLTDLGKGNDFVKKVEKKNLEGKILENFVKAIYDEHSFLNAILMNKKWSYQGNEKDMEIAFKELPDFTFAQAREMGEILIPRAFVCALKGIEKSYQTVACDGELQSHANASKVVSLSSMTNSKDVRLITVDEQGVSYAYIPFKTSVYCKFFDCSYTLPFVLKTPYLNKAA